MTGGESCTRDVLKPAEVNSVISTFKTASGSKVTVDGQPFSAQTYFTSSETDVRGDCNFMQAVMYRPMRGRCCSKNSNINCVWSPLFEE